MKKIINIMLAVLLFSGYGKAQDEIPNMQHFATPNVASFNKFEDIPVSHYTGNPNISIPVYTIQDGNINIPITLRYHGSGIKVEEEASWVGLGWNLNVGGSVTCRVHGKSDEVWYETDTTVYFMEFGKDKANTSQSLNMFSTLAPDLCYTMVPEDIPAAEADYRSKFGTYTVNSQWDNILYKGIAIAHGYFKPDLYSFTLPFYSGKFYIDHARGKAYQINGSQSVDIKFNVSGWKWIVTDANGIKYYFNTPQRRQSDYGDVRERQIPNTYYLDEIVYPNGQTVDFQYEEKASVLTQNSSSSTTYNLLSTTGYYDSWAPMCVNLGYSSSRFDFMGEHYYPRYLKRIVTSNVIVEFNLSTISRTDMPGEYELDNIKVYNSQGSMINEFDFNYSYFNIHKTGLDQKKYRRLKLESYIDGTGGEYLFDYNESTLLPSKQSYARDYWGYFNNMGTATFIPDFNKLLRCNGHSSMLDDINSSSRNVPASNRGCHEEYIKAGVLEKITYPTGGYTLFDFEPHTFSNYYYEKADASTLFVKEEAYGNQVHNFTVDKERNLTVWARMNIIPQTDAERTNPSILINIMKDCYIEFYEDNTLISRFTTNSTSYSLDEEIEYLFVPGKQYKFVTFKTPEAMNHGYSEVHVDVSYYLQDNWSIGGGLRVSEICSYNENGALSKKKQYIYEENNQSHGKLMSPLKFSSSRVAYCYSAYRGGLGRYSYYELNANSNVAISNSAGGSNVGYDKVIEKTIGGTDNGKIEYYFINEASNHVDRNFEIPELRNGLTKALNISDNNNMLESSRYEYSKLIDRNYFGFFGTPTEASTNCFYHLNFQTFTYPVPASTYVQTKAKKSSYYYDSNDNLIDSVYIETTNEYNTTNLQIRKSTTSNSTGETIITTNKYPVDYSLSATNPITLLKSNDIINPVIEQQMWKDGNLISGKVNEFGSFNGHLLPEKIYVLETSQLSNFGQNTNDNSPYTQLLPTTVPYQEKLTMDYNDLGKPTGHQKINDAPTAYIWGYNNQYPVVKIEGIAYDAISSSIKTAVETRSFTASTAYNNVKVDVDYLKALLTSLNANPGYMVSFYTYSPLVGMTSQTAPDGKTIYYEYDSFGRLETIKDQDGKVLKHTDYHYAE